VSKIEIWQRKLAKEKRKNKEKAQQKVWDILKTPHKVRGKLIPETQTSKLLADMLAEEMRKTIDYDIMEAIMGKTA